ncbi:unnamed protein product, partial [Heterosigma akashiwo]
LETSKPCRPLLQQPSPWRGSCPINVGPSTATAARAGPHTIMFSGSWVSSRPTWLTNSMPFSMCSAQYSSFSWPLRAYLPVFPQPGPWQRVSSTSTMPSLRCSRQKRPAARSPGCR